MQLCKAYIECATFCARLIDSCSRHTKRKISQANFELPPIWAPGQAGACPGTPARLPSPGGAQVAALPAEALEARYLVLLPWKRNHS